MSEIDSVNVFFDDNGDDEPVNENDSSGCIPDENLKREVARLLAGENDRLTFEAKITKGRGPVSAVWINFVEALIDGKRTSIFKCNDCTALYIYKSQSGTSSLVRHVCSVKPKSRTTSNKTDVVSISKMFLKQVPKTSIDNLNRDITKGLAKDLEPLRKVESDGFMYIAQKLINFGARFGQQPAEEVIKHRTTLKRTHLQEIFHDIQEDIKSKLLKAPTYPNFAYTTDLWYEKHQSNSFLSLTAHLIDADWNLQRYTLGMEKFEPEKKSTNNIRSECENILKNYFEEDRVEQIIQESVSVTDSGKNMLHIFVTRRPCECHKINTCNGWTFNDKAIPDAETIAKKASKGKPVPQKKLFNLQTHCPKIHSTIAGVKDLVTYFKRTNLNSQLENRLQQDVPTRFNSLYFPLKSYENAANEVKSLLLKKDKLNLLTPIDDGLVKELVLYLAPFKECCDMLSAHKYPTINRVALCYHELREHIKVSKSDSIEMQKLKGQARLCFEEYCIIEPLHYAACMLDPRYKSLKFTTLVNRKKAINLLETWIEEEIAGGVSLDRTVSEKPTEEATLPKTPSRFKRFQDDDSTTSDDTSELDRYLAYKLPETSENDEKFDVLHFWSRATEFPTLQKVAQRILAIPASEAADERTFSDAGRAMQPRRTRLGAGTLSQMVFVAENVNLKED